MRFLSSTFELCPGEALSTLRVMRRDYRNPPFSAGRIHLRASAQGPAQTGIHA